MTQTETDDITGYAVNYVYYYRTMVLTKGQKEKAPFYKTKNKKSTRMTVGSA